MVRLTAPQKEALAHVCLTNGGGVRLRCKVGDDGYVVPANASYRRLAALGLIQGKAGGFETVVHTRDGLELYRASASTAAVGSASIHKPLGPANSAAESHGIHAQGNSK